jgi:hypothetical protein
VHFQAWNLEILPSVGFDDKKGFKKGAGPLVFMMLHRDGAKVMAGMMMYRPYLARLF